MIFGFFIIHFFSRFELFFFTNKNYQLIKSFHRNLKQHYYLVTVIVVLIQDLAVATYKSLTLVQIRMIFYLLGDDCLRLRGGGGGDRKRSRDKLSKNKIMTKS